MRTDTHVLADPYQYRAASSQPPSNDETGPGDCLSAAWRAEEPPAGRRTIHQVPLPDNLLFFLAWLRNPLRAGALQPSGRELATALAAHIDPSRPGPVIELGPGTGAVTHALVERGIDPSRLVLLEQNPAFCALLRTRWPLARVLEADAYAAPLLMRSLGAPAAGIVSGLPLLTRPAHERLRLVLGCLRQAAPGAPFVQFTYFLRSPAPAPRALLRARGSAMIWRNALPARVWAYRLAGRHCPGATVAQRGIAS